MKEFSVIGNRIRLLRSERKVAQCDLAKRIGMSQTNLSNIEGGRTAATIQVLLKIREELGCSMRDFFIDFDGEIEAAPVVEEKKSIEVEDALQILKLLKAVDIKGL